MLTEVISLTSSFLRVPEKDVELTRFARAAITTEPKVPNETQRPEYEQVAPVSG